MTRTRRRTPTAPPTTASAARAHDRNAGARRRIRAAGVPVALALVALAADPGVVRVRPGDTLWGLSTRYGTTVARLRAFNDLPDDRIYAGQTLLVPVAEAAVPPARTPGSAAPAVHVVVRGDTASGIAAAHGVALGALAAANGLHGKMVIYPGQVLRLSGRPGTGSGSGSGSGTAPAPAHHPATTRPVGGGVPARHYPARVTASAARHRDLLARLPAPSKTEVRDLVGSTAATLGVDPALALAIAQQESGFQANVVSPADAIGVMQVLPSTGAWLSREVVGRDLDLFDPTDNVFAGVTLLRVLTRQAPLPDAIAGYYQGLASVRAHGMYADTVRYVASVLALRQRWR